MELRKFIPEKIKEHFQSVSMEEFEINLEKAGMGIINSSSSAGIRY